MRLADQMIADAGTERDFSHALSSMKSSLIEAEKFELSPDVYEACRHVATTKPSSLLAAIHLGRIPYPKVWVEWTPPRELGPDANGKITPSRIGFLAEGGPEIYVVTWAWAHPGHDINVCPSGVFVGLKMRREQWRKVAAIPVPDGAVSVFGEPLKPLMEQFARYRCLHSDDDALRLARKNVRGEWANLPDDEYRALLDLDAAFSQGISPHSFELVKRLMDLKHKDLMDQMLKSAMEDLAGEGTFMLSFLLMLNSPNSLDRRREDLSKLNRARIKSGKTIDLQEFTVTKLRLPSRFSEARGGTASERAAAREHRVRGHFKVRKTGVFWWSPFKRGSGIALIRRRYEVIGKEDDGLNDDEFSGHPIP